MQASTKSADTADHSFQKLLGRVRQAFGFGFNSTTIWHRYTLFWFAGQSRGAGNQLCFRGHRIARDCQPTPQKWKGKGCGPSWDRNGEVRKRVCGDGRFRGRRRPGGARGGNGGAKACAPSHGRRQLQSSHRQALWRRSYAGWRRRTGAARRFHSRDRGAPVLRNSLCQFRVIRRS
jgi:hypothetical protein